METKLVQQIPRTDNFIIEGRIFSKEEADKLIKLMPEIVWIVLRYYSKDEAKPKS